MGTDGSARRGKITQEDIANTCKIDQGSVSRILNKDTRDSFAPETVDRVFKIARELGYLHPALVTSNRRESIRRKAGFEARRPPDEGIRELLTGYRMLGRGAHRNV